MDTEEIRGQISTQGGESSKGIINEILDSDPGNYKRQNEADAQADFLSNRGNLLLEYYQKYFPFDRVVKWLTYGDDLSFRKREISYNILSSQHDDEFVIRHLCYDSDKDFKSGVIKFKPLRIDVGACFEQSPDRNKDINSRDKSAAIEREYVIDIDMSDYDRIRTGGTGKTLGQKCWKFMYLAHLVLDKALKEDFGFYQIMWVFSGRRGIHAWIGDERARGMTNESRAGVTAYLDISISNDKSEKLIKDSVRKNLKSCLLVTRSFETLKGHFEEIVIAEQQYLACDEKLNRVLQVLRSVFEYAIDNYCQSKQVKQVDKVETKNRLLSLVDEELDKLKSDGEAIKSEEQEKDKDNSHTISTSKPGTTPSEARWDKIQNFLTVQSKKQTIYEKVPHSFKVELTIGLLYPKLDAHVSAQTNHLLKCPFNIHHGTGKISIPIKDIENFSVANCPTVFDILNDESVMKPYLDIFDDFIESIQKNQS